MAATFFAKNALMNTTKSFPQTLWFPSSSVSARKVSRVSFTTAYSSSNPNQDRNTAAGEMRDRAGYRAADEKHDKDSLADEASGTIEAGAEKARKWSGDAQEKMKDNMDSAKEKAGEWKEKAKEKAGEWKEKAKDSAGSVKDKTMDAAGSMKDQTMDATESGKEKTKDVAGTVRDKAKSGADNATQTVSNAGEKAKETVKNVWEATKDTTQKIKETVVGKAEDISSDEDVADRKDSRDP